MDAAGGTEARGGSKCGRPGAGAAPDAYGMCGCTVDSWEWEGRAGRVRAGGGGIHLKMRQKYRTDFEG